MVGSLEKNKIFIAGGRGLSVDSFNLYEYDISQNIWRLIYSSSLTMYVFVT